MQGMATDLGPLPIACGHKGCGNVALKSSRYCMSHDHLYAEEPAPQKMREPKIVEDPMQVLMGHASGKYLAVARKQREAEMRADLRARWAFELYRDLLHRVRIDRNLHLIGTPESIAVEEADALLDALGLAPDSVGRLLPD